MRRRLLALLALACAAPTISVAAAPLTTCSPAWLDRYEARVTMVMHVGVDDPEATIIRVREHLLEHQALITSRGRNNGRHHLHAQLNTELDVRALLDSENPEWIREQEKRQPQNVRQQCEQLRVARTLAERLQGWLRTAKSDTERVAVVRMLQTHLQQVQNLDNQVRNIERNGRVMDVQLQAQTRTLQAKGR